ncbi:hypothetical protein L1049_028009 [Liquidambar formosana]|uniref:non-specific serine/threonine protein kinase n=1 Tax=Liquidambar formosana TaxID=63359 RepID=A0AAP0RI86_LIQFO
MIISLQIFYTNHSFLLVNSALSEDSCPTPLHNISLDGTLFSYSSTYSNLSLFYNCTSEPADYLTYYSVQYISNATFHSFAIFHKEGLSRVNYSIESCQSWVDAPVDLGADYEFESLWKTNYTEILKMGFVLNWTANNCSNCERSGGHCRFDDNKFLCFCSDRPHLKTCDDGFGALGIGILLPVAFIFYRRCNKKLYDSSFISRSISSQPSSMTDLENMVKYFGVNIFTYKELVEATNNFDSSKELGDGGFGTVYYGKLRDGRVVAVKRLYENNYKRVEQFMNEVEILTRLRHQYLVALYGCTSRHSRELLLVYEYISNGTVADHLHGERAKAGSLPWPIRMSIAIETASALKYLHASEIIHRDVKTNNILLDDNFRVKVADFGLSRLFPFDVTHVSTAPQGTPGCVDPDYHQCYQLTSKSDVYSFGVVLIELISSKPAVDITRHRHEINLSNMAINKIQNHALHELVDPSLGFESDYKVNKMITAVAELAFRCLKNGKDMRPPIEEVLESLKEIQSEGYNVGKTQEVDIPADNVVLLKNGPMPLSPDSVTLKWTSSSTTPNASG